ALRRGLPVHRGRLVPQGDGIAGRRFLAFAGIGRPEKFFATLAEAGAVLAGTRAFPDHHAFREKDLAGLAAAADGLGAELVTTEKDAVRLPASFLGRVRVLPVRLRFTEEEPVRTQLQGLREDAP
ncbi:tetraacyldisaccharide 4'-kinase, partial [Methylobacterium trifolii]